MIKVLIFSILGLVVGGGLGFGGGMFLFPAEPAAEAVESTPADDSDTVEAEEVAYADFSEQFIIPLILDDEVDALMILSISLEVDASILETVFDQEPKLRSEFLQSMFNHANNGGFTGNFTQFSAMASLKRELLAIAQNVLGPAVNSVLILDAVRQDQ